MALLFIALIVSLPDFYFVKMTQDVSILASTLIARIFGYHFSLYDEFRFIDMARKRPFGNDFYFKIIDFVLSRFFL